MNPLLTAASLGFVTGMIGAVAPGPLSVALIDRRTRSESGVGLWGGLGGPLVQMMVCVAIALAAVSPVLSVLGHTTWSRPVIGVGCTLFGIGLAIAAGMRVPSAPSIAPDDLLETGALRNRVLIVKWMVVIGTVLASTGPVPELGWGLAFGIGVWLGIAGWFSALLTLARPGSLEKAPVLTKRLIVGGAGLIVLLGAAATMRAL